MQQHYITVIVQSHIAIKGWAPPGYRNSGTPVGIWQWSQLPTGSTGSTSTMVRRNVAGWAGLANNFSRQKWGNEWSEYKEVFMQLWMENTNRSPTVDMETVLQWIRNTCEPPDDLLTRGETTDHHAYSSSHSALRYFDYSFLTGSEAV